jgi:hypothetical protein
MLERVLFDDRFRAQQQAHMSEVAPTVGATRRVADLVYELGEIDGHVHGD